jgi:subtilisin family serine protease
MEPIVQGLRFPANCALPLSNDPFDRPLTPFSYVFSGVAKAANVVAVKVLSDEGSGQNSDMWVLIFNYETNGADMWASPIHSISGLNFVASEFQRTGTPTVASLSLGGGTSNAVDSAVVRVRLTIWVKPFIRPNFLRLF